MPGENLMYQVVTEKYQRANLELDNSICDDLYHVFKSNIKLRVGLGTFKIDLNPPVILYY